MSKDILCILLYIFCSIVTFGHAHVNGDCTGKPEHRRCSEQITGDAIVSTMFWPYYVSKELWKAKDDE